VVATTDTPAAQPDGQQAEGTQTEVTQRAEHSRAGRERTGTAFLLAQLGSYAAERFGERAGALDFTRPQAGLLRLIGREPGQSQQAVARRLGTPPSRLVALVDGLEQRGLIERRRNPGDRRNYALYLTPAGKQAMAGLAQAAADHDEEIGAPLTPAERADLHKLLAKLAAAHGLLPGVHPGYRHLAATVDTDARPAGQEMR
jgi:DNA-binding MarR family transcriptional regulator